MPVGDIEPWLLLPRMLWRPCCSGPRQYQDHKHINENVIKPKRKHTICECAIWHEKYNLLEMVQKLRDTAEKSKKKTVAKGEQHIPWYCTALRHHHMQHRQGNKGRTNPPCLHEYQALSGERHSGCPCKCYAELASCACHTIQPTWHLILNEYLAQQINYKTSPPHCTTTYTVITICLMTQNVLTAIFRCYK